MAVMIATDKHILLVEENDDFADLLELPLSRQDHRLYEELPARFPFPNFFQIA